MDGRIDSNLYNFLLVQKSINLTMPFDVIEPVIQKSIDYLKDNNLNARIANVVFNINGKLVLAQIYVERKNAFAPTKDNRFGTSPTAYNVQVRFPYGLETRLGASTVTLPTGSFNRSLQPYKSHSGKVVDDVQRDTEAKDLICGPGVTKKIHGSDRVSLSTPGAEPLIFSSGNEIGKGYVFIHISGDNEYSELKDYNARLKMHGLYPLFYSGGPESKTIFRRHPEYPGYTISQVGTYEPQEGKEERLDQYQQFMALHEREVSEQKIGQEWIALGQKARGSHYVLDISIVNGVVLYTETGLPMTRLRDYQLELFQGCLQFIEQVKRNPHQRPASKINMSVGAGKTFCTFTFLQHLKYGMQTAQDPQQIKPPFCMAPDADVANVTKRSIDRQGVTSGTSATAVTRKEQMPNTDFLAVYESLSHHAQNAARKMNAYIQEGLQNEILQLCHENNYHPLATINLLYGLYGGYYLPQKIKAFKDSIDVKRLLLLVEGQKIILNKTGMLGIDGLLNLLEQFTAIREGIEEKSYEFKRSSHPTPIKPFKINYNQIVQSSWGPLNLATLEPGTLLELFKKRHKNNLRAIREAFMRMASLANKDAAVLLANSGGLGNTYTAAELEKQINDFLPIAVAQISTLASKKEHRWQEHYLLYLYINEIFSTIPSEIFINRHLEMNSISIDDFKSQVLCEGMNFNLQLVSSIEERIKEKIKDLGTVGELKLPEVKNSDLAKRGIAPSDNPIKAANQLAGIASLAITGHAVSDEAKLLLSHVPVFTPEGLASYVEYLETLEGQPKFIFKEELGVYKIIKQGKTSRQDIKLRLQQFLSSMMIADEIHKDAFRFLYDAENEIYQRVDRVVQRYFGASFLSMLPPRLGMSGTINAVSVKAFSKETLYEFSSQKMIAQGLVKKISMDTHVPPPCSLEGKLEDQDKRAYAKQVVADYFVQNSHLSIQNILTAKNYSIDLFSVSKGLIFSKVADPLLNEYIAGYFNLLIKEVPAGGQETEDQQALLASINQKRKAQAAQLRSKLLGTLPLTEAEAVQVEIYNRQYPSGAIQTRRNPDGQMQVTSAIEEKKVEEMDFTVARLREMHRHHFINNLFAICLEYLLSKSSVPQEFSDIVGMQNKLHERGSSLIEGVRKKKKLLALIASIDPKSISQEDVASFINERIKVKGLARSLIEHIVQSKIDVNQLIERLNHNTAGFLTKLITTDRHEFESGTTLAMLGAESEQTGYSHEPVGIVVDVSSAQRQIHQLNFSLEKIKENKFEADDLHGFLSDLQGIAEHAFSYDEKNQVGGRALRTPYGHVKYLQYQSNMNHFLAEFKLDDQQKKVFEALKVETSFDAIFTANETLAQQERHSIGFNRLALSLLRGPMEYTPAAFSQAVADHFSEQLQDEVAKNQYENYIKQRLPLLWAMKYKPELAYRFFNSKDAQAFDEIRAQFTFRWLPLPIRAVSKEVPPAEVCFDELDEIKEEQEEQKRAPFLSNRDAQPRGTASFERAVKEHPSAILELKDKEPPCPQNYRQKLGQSISFSTKKPTWSASEARDSLLKGTPDQILPNLLLANRSCGEKYLRDLRKNSQVAILRCASRPASGEDALMEGEHYKTITIGDLPDKDIQSHFDTCFDFIEKALKEGRKILVHCNAGASRSPTIVASYLIRKYGLTAHEALNHIKTKRPCVNTENFIPQLVQYANRREFTVAREFLARHQASYRSGCSGGLFSRTNLRAFTQDNAGFDKGLDMQSIIAHAQKLTFFGNKNRTRLILEEMNILNEAGERLDFTSAIQG